MRELMMTSTRLPIVGVIGSGTEPHEPRATLLGSWLAGQGVHLLTGAGQGVMAAVGRAFAVTANRKGLVLGIVPCIAEGKPQMRRDGYPNDWVEVPIYTHLHLSGPLGEDVHSRNHLIALTANVLVALPGGEGTASEVRLAVRYTKPLIAFLNDRGEIPGLPAGVRVEPGFKEVQAFVARALAAAK
jgi:uncharacterized protein (TIGR00725 family)